jgi:hypothetical protein
MYPKKISTDKKLEHNNMITITNKPKLLRMKPYRGLKAYSIKSEKRELRFCMRISCIENVYVQVHEQISLQLHFLIVFIIVFV